LTKFAANLLDLTVNLNNGQGGTPVSTYPDAGGASSNSSGSTTTLRVSTTTSKATN